MRGRIIQIAALSMAMLMLAAPAAGVGNTALVYEGDNSAPNPTVKVSAVTVESYDVGWGDSLKYEADDGTTEELSAELNRSTDVDDLGTGTVNPFTFTVTDVNFSQAGEFPRKSDEGDNEASALDASEWTEVSATTSDVTTAPNVDAVRVDGSTSTDNATYTNFSITSDADKRYVQAFYDINSASSTTVMQIHDSDGDYVEIELYNSTGDTSSDNVGANTTGEGKAVQVQVGTLTVQGSGDGSMDELQKVHVEGNAQMDFSAINAEKMGKWTLGTKNVDNDDDDDLETETLYEATGPISVDSISSMGSTFDNAEIMGLEFPAHFEAKHVDSDDVDAEFQSGDEAGYSQWDQHADIYYSLELPDAYDLSYSGAELTQTTKWVGDRYKTVEYAEDVSDDTAFGDIEDSSWTDKTSAFSSKDKTISIDSTIQPGTNMMLHYSMVFTDGEASAMQDTASSSGGSGGIFGGGGSGIFGIPVVGWIAGGIAAIGARLGGLI